MKPHKHAELIKAWADGAEIEYFSKTSKEWVNCTENPYWDGTFDFRIKPEPKPELELDNLLYLAREMEYAFQNQGNLDGRVWANRLINYIRTGELKSAEVLK